MSKKETWLCSRVRRLHHRSGIGTPLRFQAYEQNDLNRLLIYVHFTALRANLNVHTKFRCQGVVMQIRCYLWGILEIVSKHYGSELSPSSPSRRMLKAIAFFRSAS